MYTRFRDPEGSEVFIGTDLKLVNFFSNLNIECRGVRKLSNFLEIEIFSTDALIETAAHKKAKITCWIIIKKILFDFPTPSTKTK